jgi:P27 family predicted phage terminase small subunit
MKKPGRKSAAELAFVTMTDEPVHLYSKPPAPPAHLSAEAKDWWKSVTSEYLLEAHHLKLLQAGAEAWDRCQMARRALAKHGLTYVDERGMVRSRPEIGIERDSRLAFVRIVRELDLDSEPAREERSRPPSLRSNRR